MIDEHDEAQVESAKRHRQVRENPPLGRIIEDLKAVDDPVNHPAHYQGAGGLEAIDVIEAFLGLEGAYFYCRGNALKYELRAGAKGYTAQDHRKAAWYSERAATLWEKLGEAPL